MAIQALGGTAPSLNLEYEPRLIRAAHEFEGEMLKELLKPLTAGAGLTVGETADSSSGILGEFASEALGRGLSEHGGFGIAEHILRQFSRSGNQPGMDAVTELRHFDTAVRSS
jgi:Rod binding domain-containing protein